MNFKKKLGLLISGMLVATAGMLSPVHTLSPIAPANAVVPESVIAGPVTTVNGANVQLVTVSDGNPNNYGTNNACIINTANGYPVGDDGPQDGNICANDTYTASLNIEFPSSIVEQTYVLSNKNIGTSGAINFNSLRGIAEMCISDPARGLTAKWNSTNWSCTYTVAANSPSFTISGKISAIIVDESIVTSILSSLPIGFESNGEKIAEVPTPKINILSTPMADLYLSNDYQNEYSYVNGTVYIDYVARLWNDNISKYSVSLGNIIRGGGVNFKNVKVQLDNQLPDSVQLILPPGATYDKDTRTITFSYLFGGYNEFKFRVPLTAEKVALDGYMKIIDYETTTNPVYYYTELFGGTRKEPGYGMPVNYNTADKSLGILAHNPPNNDWIKEPFFNPPPVITNGIFNKLVYLHTIDGSDKVAHNSDNSVYKPGLKTWTILSISNSYGTIDNTILCDKWDAKQQSVDTSRNSYINIKNAQNKEIDTSKYSIMYGTTSDSGTCQDNNIVWSNTPTETSNVLKVDLGSINIMNDGTYTKMVSVKIPFVASSDTSNFVFYPEITRVSDTGSISFTSPDGSSVAGSMVGSYQIGGYKISTIPRNQNITNNTLNAASASNTLRYFASIEPSWGYDGTENDNILKLEHAVTISSCAIDVTIDSYSRIVERPNWGVDGIPCTDDDISGWSIIRNSSLLLPTGSTSDSFNYPVTLAPNSAGRKLTTTHSVVGTNSYATDPYDPPVTHTFSIVANSMAGQYKTAQTSRAKVGSDVPWTLYHYNGLNTDVSNGTYLDILPYNGYNGTKLAKPLSNVRINANNNPPEMGTTIKVTTVDPTTIPTIAQDAAALDIWCDYGSTTCPEGGNYTAILTHVNSLPAGTTNKVDVTVSTEGSAHNDKLVNQQQQAFIETDSLSILPGNTVTTDLYLNTISGKVYFDADKSYSFNDDEVPIPKYLVTLQDAAGKTIATQYTDNTGKYSFAGYPDNSDYKVVVSNTALQAYNDRDTTTANVHIETADITEVDFGIFQEPTISITKTSSPSTGKVGDVITYSIRITNTSLVPMIPTITDEQCGSLSLSSANYETPYLDPNEKWNYKCSHIITQADFDAGPIYRNTATVVGDDLMDATTNPTATAFADITIVQPVDVNFSTCFNNADCSVPLSSQPLTYFSKATSTNASGSSLYTGLNANSSGNVVIPKPAGLRVKEIVIDGVKQSTTTLTSVTTPGTGVKNVIIVYEVAPVGSKDTPPKTPVFESGI